MQSILLRELKEFGTAPRPWPEEQLIPVHSLNETKTDATERFPSRIAGRPLTSQNTEKRTLQLLKLVQQQKQTMNDLRLRDQENAAQQTTVGPSPVSATPNTLFAQVRERRRERKASLAGVRHIVASVVDSALRGIRKADVKRSQIVMENTLRTVEGVYQSKLGDAELDEDEIRRTAERTCKINVGLLFDHNEFLAENLQESMPAPPPSQHKRPRRIPFAELETPTSQNSAQPVFTTPVLQATRVSALMNANNIVNQQIVQLPALPASSSSSAAGASENQYVTPVQRRKD